LETIGSLDLDGDFPTAKINWFQIYLSCTEILGNFAALRQGDVTGAVSDLDTPREEREDLIQDGQKFVKSILPHANEYQDKDSASDFLYDNSEAVAHATNTIRGALKGEIYSNDSQQETCS